MQKFYLLQVLVTLLQIIFPVFIPIMKESRDRKRLQIVGKHIKNIRESLKLSQDDVAARCDVTKGNLSMIENGKKDLAFTTFLEIAKGLGVHPKELLDVEFE